MLVCKVVKNYLQEQAREARADYQDIKIDLEQFQDYLINWTPVPVEKIDRISMVHFQEFLSWWYIRHCHPSPLAARHLLLTLEDFCKFVYKRFYVDLFSLYRPVLEELKEDLPRVISLSHAVSPLKQNESLRYLAAVYGLDRAREMGILADNDYEDVEKGYMSVAYLGDGTEVELHSLSKNIDIGPVKLSYEAARLIREGDIIYLEVGEKKGRWEVIEAGFAYPALARHFIKGDIN
ncbi:MAG: hypothetical protein H0Z35_11740 [Thermoanaerobacteraceae bacterium]|nr:hypothetical protein [Thermoanaerobacteraceae bacterium]